MAAQPNDGVVPEGRGFSGIEIRDLRDAAAGYPRPQIQNDAWQRLKHKHCLNLDITTNTNLWNLLLTTPFLAGFNGQNFSSEINTPSSPRMNNSLVLNSMTSLQLQVASQH